MEIGERKLVDRYSGERRTIFTYERNINGELFEFDVLRENLPGGYPDPHGRIIVIYAYDENSRLLHRIGDAR